MPRLDELETRLAELDRAGLLRLPLTADELVGSADCLVACTNDYLGMGASDVSRETPISGFAGSGASRLIHGTHPEHLELETALATWVRQPSALLFATGYAANLGTLACLCGPDSVVISDALNHASLIDGCRLSRARVAIARHTDTGHVKQLLEEHSAAAARWVVVESYYSMDGDSPDLRALRALCDRHDAHLVVDEAHALGVFGPRGAGLCALAGVTPDVLIGTLGKAVGVAGAFVAGSADLRTWLWNRARSFVFSTAPPPFQAALALRHLHRAQHAESARARLDRHATALRELLRAGGLQLPASNHGPILPILLGRPQRASAAAATLRAHGVLAQAIRPPTVPADSSRLRVTVNAGMTSHDIARLAEALCAACR